MGWFWADPAPRVSVAPHPIPSSDATPPPGCPMHKPSDAAPLPPLPTASKASKSSGGCPYTPPDAASPTTVDAEQHTSSRSTLSKLNPLNYMPTDLSQAASPHQSVSLPLERERSTIPKGDDGAGMWEYPSPQQMYNALLRKGYTDTPAEHVESMVAVHNFLNEGAWGEIVEWERRFSRGLWQGMSECAMGEDGCGDPTATDVDQPRLVRFMGRPNELTPKARMQQFLSTVWPAKYGSEPPFDRHDWFVKRCMNGKCKEVRYVIDYYEGPPEPTGEPVFYLDVRPAVDGPTAACERLLRWGGDVWWRASGGAARTNPQQR